MNQKKIHPVSILVAIVFMVVGVLWLTLSDHLIVLLVGDPERIMAVQAIKDWIFLALIALAVFLLLNHEINQRESLINTISAESEWQKLLISKLPDTEVFLLDSNLNPLFYTTDEPEYQLKDLIRTELKKPDRYCAYSTRPTLLLDELSNVLKGNTLELAVDVGEKLLEILAIPMLSSKKVTSILLLAIDRTQHRDLVNHLSNERRSFAKLSEKYHEINSELAIRHNQLKDVNVDLNENKERYSAFIQQTSEAVYRIDLKKPINLELPFDTQVAAIISTGFLAEYNPAFSQIYKLNSTKSYIGKSHYEIYPENNHVQSQGLIEELVHHNYNLKDHESVEYDSKGHTRYFLNNIVGIIEKNKLTRFWGTKLETTRQKKHERELILAKKAAEESSKLKTAFLANMSHEIRTPLNGILGFSELLCNSSLPDKKRDKYYRIIEASNQQLLRIINDILDISRIQTNQISISKSDFPLNILIQEIETSLRHEIEQKGSKINLKIDKYFNDEEDIIHTDRDRLYQILTNLSNNAVKFTEDGDVTISYEPKSSSIMEFSIRDTGIGIPSEYLASIFDQFRQVEEFASRNYGGTGLGLSISKGLVELLGGYIAVESEEDVGSTFRFTIKYA